MPLAGQDIIELYEKYSILPTSDFPPNELCTTFFFEAPSAFIEADLYESCSVEID